MKDLNLFLKNIRVSRNITIEVFSSIVGVSRSLWHLIEKDKRKLRPDIAESILNNIADLTCDEKAMLKKILRENYDPIFMSWDLRRKAFRKNADTFLYYSNIKSPIAKKYAENIENLIKACLEE